MNLLSLRSHVLGAADPVLFARDLGLEPDPWQIEMMRSNRKRIHTLVCRQGGKTTTTALIATHQALYRPGSLTLIISPSLRQSQEMFRKIAAFYAARGKPIPPEAENSLSLVLENGSRVLAMPAGEGTIRGYSVDLLVVDEGARVGDDVWASVLPMVGVTKGRVIALSTPAGRRGWFYEASRSLRWQRFKVAGEECPRLTEGDLEEARELLGDLAYRQEYGCEFVDAAGSAFSGEDIEAIFGAAPPRPSTSSDAQARRTPASRLERDMARIARRGPRFGDDAVACRHGNVGRCFACVSGQGRPVR